MIATIIPGQYSPTNTKATSPTIDESGPVVVNVPVGAIVASAANPRKHFDEEALRELADSIKEHGIIEPLVVRERVLPPIDQAAATRAFRKFMLGEKSLREAMDREFARADGAFQWRVRSTHSFRPQEWPDMIEAYRAAGAARGLAVEVGEPLGGMMDGHRWILIRDAGTPSYELIAGERRLRAAKVAGLTHVPARIITVDDMAAMKLRLVENLARVDLDPVEEAEGYRALHDVLGLTQTEIAKAVNRSQPSIANAMRVLDLPEDVVERIRKGELTRGHGVALAKYKLAPALQSRLADDAVKGQMTVKALESPRAIYNHQYVEDGLLRFVNPWQAGFDTTVCQSCPFGAYIPDHEGGDYSDYCQPVCLKPDHFDQLQKEAQKRRNAETQREIAKVRASGDKVLKIERMETGSYVRLQSYDRPEACTDQCPCFAKALEKLPGNQEPRLVPVCTDVARLRKLRAQESKEKHEAARARHREALAGLPDRMATIPYALDDELEHRLVALRRPMALVASAALNDCLNGDIAKSILARYGVELPRELHGYQITAATMEALRKLKLSTLLSLTAEVVLRRDLAESLAYANGTGPRYGERADWYLGIGKEKVL